MQNGYKRINWFNVKFIKWDGYGRYGMSCLQALNRRGVDVFPGVLGDIESHPGWLLRMQGFDFSKLSISLTPGHTAMGLPGRHWVYTMWESDKIRDDWVANLNNNCERILTPCEWNKEALQRAGISTTINVVHGGVDVQEFPFVERRPTSRPYIFGALGDRGSRKGWSEAWQAFYNAFGDNPDVRLVIKSRFGSLKFIDTTNSDGRVSFWRNDLESMSDFFAHIDCFVYPTRGEGWGMPPREAAAMGLPVIASNYGGTAVGIEHWALPLTTGIQKAGDWPKGLGGNWGKVDVDELTEHMKWCYENRGQAIAKGRAAAQWLRAHQTWDHTADRIIDLLERYA